MLDINEYNKLLYKQLDRKAEEKNMISDYGRYLQHSKSKDTESGIELQAASWLANFRGLTTSNGFLKTPQGMKEICEGLIPQASKLLRKANKKGAPEETKAELRNARKFLEDCLADANAALQHSDEDPEHLEHGGKWRHHDYIDIKNGKYIYAKDKKPNREALQKLENLKKIEAKNTKYVIDKAHEATQAGANYRLAKQFDPEEKNASTQEQKKKAEETDKIYKDSFRIASLSNKSARDAINKEAKESAEVKAKSQQIDAETDARKKAGNDAARASQGEAQDLWKKEQEEKKKQDDLKRKQIIEGQGARIAAETKAKKDRISNITDPNDPYLIKEMQYFTDTGNFARKKREELLKKNKIKHSDDSPSMAATAMSRDEYEELLKKAESLT